MAKTKFTMEDYLKAFLSRPESKPQEPSLLEERLSILLEEPVQSSTTALFILSLEQLEALVLAAAMESPKLTPAQRALFKASKVLPRKQPSRGYVVSPQRLGQLVHPHHAAWPLLTWKELDAIEVFLGLSDYSGHYHSEQNYWDQRPPAVTSLEGPEDSDASEPGPTLPEEYSALFDHDLLDHEVSFPQELSEDWETEGDHDLLDHEVSFPEEQSEDRETEGDALLEEEIGESNVSKYYLGEDDSEDAYWDQGGRFPKEEDPWGPSEEEEEDYNENFWNDDAFEDFNNEISAVPPSFREFRKRLASQLPPERSD